MNEGWSELCMHGGGHRGLDPGQGGGVRPLCTHEEDGVEGGGEGGSEGGRCGGYHI